MIQQHQRNPDFHYFSFNFKYFFVSFLRLQCYFPSMAHNQIETVVQDCPQRTFLPLYRKIFYCLIDSLYCVSNEIVVCATSCFMHFYCLTVLSCFHPQMLKDCFITLLLYKVEFTINELINNKRICLFNFGLCLSNIRVRSGFLVAIMYKYLFVVTV